MSDEKAFQYAQIIEDYKGINQYLHNCTVIKMALVEQRKTLAHQLSEELLRKRHPLIDATEMKRSEAYKEAADIVEAFLLSGSEK